MLGREILFLKRLTRRVKHLLNFKKLKEAYDWDYESCTRCGSLHKIAYSVKDETWSDVCGSFKGILCLDCFIEQAAAKEINLTRDDFTWLSLCFNKVNCLIIDN